MDNNSFNVDTVKDLMVSSLPEDVWENVKKHINAAAQQCKASVTLTYTDIDPDQQYHTAVKMRLRMLGLTVKEEGGKVIVSWLDM